MYKLIKKKFMKQTYARRYRRSHSSARETAIFKKDSQQEHAFFSAPSKESFFKPNAAIERKCDHCEAEEKKVSRMGGDEEKKIQKVEDKKEEVHRQPEHKEEEKTIHKMEDKKEELHRQSEPKEEEKSIAKKENDVANNGMAATSTYIQSLSSKGTALPKETQQFFAKRMGYDFSHVKIHRGTEAEQSAKEVNAKAYAVDNNIVFNKGQYNTTSAEGKKLLAHELTHVVQQRGNPQELINRIAEKAKAGYPVTSVGRATNSQNQRAYGCEGLSVQGHTDANYADSYNAVGTATPSSKCNADDCADDCVVATGTIVSVFQASPSVTLPSVPDGLSDCESNAVTSFINTTLNTHEQKHVAAFNTYNGTVKTPYKFTGCQADLDAYQQSIHDKINAKRQAAANAKSKKLDPFNPTIPCHCETEQ